MRLHRLTLTAFGPFAGTEEVDFDRLASTGLFLLRGATGAGKSSVLDAVCYALYGEVPGARRGNPLRSDHAAPGLLTEVRLDLTLGSRRLEITRSPEQQRPKLRGTGTTTEKPQTLLREWAADAGGGTPGWRAVSRSHQEAGEEIRRLVGMSREQFCQVVLLPQGDFARFLRADTKQRAELLGRLFDTQRFGQVERWLAERRLRQEAAVRDGRQRLRDLAARAAEAAGPGGEPADDWLPAEDGSAASAAGLVDGVLGWAAILRSQAAEQRAVADAALAAARQAQADADGRRRAADTLAEQQLRHAAAVGTARRLAEEGAALGPERRRLAAARAALGVESALRLRAAAEHAHAAAAEAEEQCRAALRRRFAAVPVRAGAAGSDTGGGAGADGGLGTLLPHQAGPAGARPVAGADAAALAAEERRLRTAVGELTAARAAERRHDEAGREAADLTHRRDTAEQLVEDARDWLAEVDARLKALQAERAAAEDAAGTVLRLDERRAELAGRRAAADRRDTVRADLARAEQHERGAHDLALTARATALDLQERRLAGMAAELAGALRAGDPCRVCGAAEHPAPARPGEGQVTAGDQRRAAAAQADAEQRLEDARRTVAGLRADESAALAVAGETASAELAEQLAAVEAERSAAVRRADALGTTVRRIEQLTTEQRRREEQLRAGGADAAAANARLQDLAAERLRLTELITGARGDAPSVAARARQLDENARAVAAALNAVHAAAEASGRLSEAERELLRATAEAGFATPDEARAAVLPAAGRSALEARLEAHDRAVAAVEAELVRPELVAAAALPPADPVAAGAGQARAADRLQRAAAEAGAAERRCAALARIGAELAGLAAALAPELAEFGRISRLAALVAGAPAENALRMRLESYVLAARLEQVAAAASDRLVRMSGGRYTLVHSDGPVAGTKRSGLSLRVVDAWTGRDRDTATLSGGESFFASLALALGLADVVTDEAGGMPLDTLFIDEGFGSLDEQTLEEVMDVLDGLRERDRAVGIVSHVADLRSRIPSQLVVRKQRHGSTLAVADREDA
ncbi:SMC family ATPase [Kitasatospora sp. NPDC085895]|uniref:SMC family ATPase n=1 Tax=Kitasatospora sp. NPDC085895 TaxID=3155057 RepID=UPI00344D5691